LTVPHEFAMRRTYDDWLNDGPGGPNTPEAPEELPMPEVNTFNRWMVGAIGDRLSMLRPPLAGELMEKDDALVLAAWLVALADPDGRKFREVLEAVQNT
jgi:hypothetical protein